MSKTNNPKEDELRKLSVELRYFEQTAESLQQKLNMMNAAQTDLTYANITLENIQNEPENAQLLVPIGGSTYIKAKLASTEKILIGLGAGVNIEKPLPQAQDIIKKRIAELEKNQNQLKQQLEQILERINQSRTQMENLLAQIRQGQQ